MFTHRSGALTWTLLTAFACAIVHAQPTLVAYWNFEESAGDTLHDVTANGHHGLIEGAVWAPGVTGTGLYFNGTNAKVTVPFKRDLNLRQYTLSAWIKSSKTSTPQMIVSRQPTPPLPDTGAYWNYRLFLNNEATISPKGHVISDFLLKSHATLQWEGTYAASSMAVTDGFWHHIAAIMRGTVMEIYVDGKLDLKRNTGYYPDTISKEGLMLGASVFYDPYFFEGTMDEVRIYSVALDTGAVAALYRNPPITLSARTGPAHLSNLRLEKTGTHTYSLRGLGDQGALVDLLAPDGRNLSTWTGVLESRALDLSGAGKGLFFIRVRQGASQTRLLSLTLP